MTLPPQARTVVIGGVGASVAYRLARSGWSDMVPLESERLTSGTTWHAAGPIAQLRATAAPTRLARYSRELYGAPEARTGIATGVHGVGSITAAPTAGRPVDRRRRGPMATSVSFSAPLRGLRMVRRMRALRLLPWGGTP